MRLHLTEAKRLFSPCLVLAILFAANHVSRAQGLMVPGRVVDPAGATIPNAQVKVLSGGHAIQATITNTRGEFVLTLPSNRYDLLITAKGFADQFRMLDLEARETVPLEIVLQVAGSEVTVTVNYNDGDSQTRAISSATKTLTSIRDLPQSITIVTNKLVEDQAMQSIEDVVSYVPGVTATQGENNRDQLVIRGNSTSADFFQNGLRDDAQYYRDLYNLERLEALKGPNAMIFGRGGGGGVINRVTKEPVSYRLGRLTLQSGSQRNKRITGDINKPLSSAIWFRANSVYENSGSFRDHVGLNRFGFNPTLSINAGNQSQLRFAFEHLRDNRVADRGIPSFNGLPASIDISLFFGDPSKSLVRSRVNLLTAALDHQAGKLNIRNRTLLGYYRRFYQNFVPGAVDDHKNVKLSAYNNATQRRNLFNQTDLTYGLKTAAIKHSLLVGSEFGFQRSVNFRQTGFFNGVSPTIDVPLAKPTISEPVTFHQISSDADNYVVARVGAIYAQDQLELSPKIQLLAGVRLDRFSLGFHNNRDAKDLSRIDVLFSPRAGIVYKPISAVSIYGSYSVSYLPSSGDQFSSLTDITQTLKPEKFTNYEAGLKWDVFSALSLTAAAYRLDRKNTRGVDPNDPTRVVQTGAQRSQGLEAELTGRIMRHWRVTGGYAYQNAFVMRATTRAMEGARVAQVPRNAFSIWNHFSALKHWSGGVGIIHRSNMFAAIDDKVILPAYTRADAALFYSVNEWISLQANVENFFNKKYYANADSNNNISPGSPRRIRFGMAWKF